MYRRLRLMTCELTEMAEGLVWTSDPESLVFTMWLLPAATIESVYFA